MGAYVTRRVLVAFVQILVVATLVFGYDMLVIVPEGAASTEIR